MTTARRYGVARTLSKLGLASRTAAAGWVHDGRVAVNGRVVRDPDYPVVQGRDQLSVDGRPVAASGRIYLLLNKPRGLVTTANDEQARQTVYRCFDGAGLPWIAPVGRLDKASEGLLLFSNDPEWAARITDPATGPDKTYHVQVATRPDPDVLRHLVAGIDLAGEHLAAKSAQLLRAGAKNAWLELVLTEGRNRHIRRLLEAHNIPVLRLVRVAIGALELGDLARGQWRRLDAGDLSRLGVGPHKSG
ncbi:MAG: rRNA pseudouridine synthase [Gammaproteobacteria bacterium]|nr:rRNA pseudouridine synthase [Gammaproteobacteria bacterium]MDH5275792.1 rRNA pseudouridine synthase [Gammaproteobacteria bacterium]